MSAPCGVVERSGHTSKDGSGAADLANLVERPRMGPPGTGYVDLLGLRDGVALAQKSQRLCPRTIGRGNVDPRFTGIGLDGDRAGSAPHQLLLFAICLPSNASMTRVPLVCPVGRTPRGGHWSRLRPPKGRSRVSSACRPCWPARDQVSASLVSSQACFILASRSA
jgi:hypothetical protein